MHQRKYITIAIDAGNPDLLIFPALEELYIYIIHRRIVAQLRLLLPVFLHEQQASATYAISRLASRCKIINGVVHVVYEREKTEQLCRAMYGAL